MLLDVPVRSSCTLDAHRFTRGARRWSRLPGRKNAHRGLSVLSKPASRPTRSQVPIASGENSPCVTIPRRTPLLQQGSLETVTVTAHRYSIVTPTTCTPGDAFSSLEAPGMSAPGAPAAQEGFTSPIPLWHITSPNQISQFVNTPSMTIVNTALDGHIFQGTVTTQVSPMGTGSTITTVGKGRPGESWWRSALNDVAGPILFTMRNYFVQTGCDAANGIPNNL